MRQHIAATVVCTLLAFSAQALEETPAAEPPPVQQLEPTQPIADPVATPARPGPSPAAITVLFVIGAGIALLVLRRRRA